MISVVCGRKNNHTVKDRRDFRGSLSHVAIPKFQVPLPFRFPLLCQIKQGIQSSMSLYFVMPIKVGVDFQEVTGTRDHLPTTDVIGIAQKTVDSRKLLEKKQKLTGL